MKKYQKSEGFSTYPATRQVKDLSKTKEKEVEG